MKGFPHKLISFKARTMLCQACYKFLRIKIQCTLWPANTVKYSCDCVKCLSLIKKVNALIKQTQNTNKPIRLGFL